MLWQQSRALAGANSRGNCPLIVLSIVCCCVYLIIPGRLCAGDFYVPSTISKQAQEHMVLYTLAGRDIPLPEPSDLQGWRNKRAAIEEIFAQPNADVVKRYEPSIKRSMLGGVPVLDIKPATWKSDSRILLYVHGGGYTLFSADSTLVCAVPLAHDTGVRVISIDYALAPQSGWREIVGQTTAVVRALVEQGQNLKALAICGDSAGGALAAGTVLKCRDDGIGMPGAVVFWSPWSDISSSGDTYGTLKDADPVLRYTGILEHCARAYAAPEDWKQPYVSPVYADYSQGFPPTLIQAGTREILLSDAVRLYRALANADIPVFFDPYEGMWHVFQGFPGNLPESQLARQNVGKFLDKYLSH